MEQIVVGVIPHNYEKTVTLLTETTKGTVTYTCTECGDTYSETIMINDFTVTKENRAMIGYTGEANENLVIPAVFESNGVWYRVTSIGNYAFDGCEALTSIVIPEGVTSIGKLAFLCCYNLKNISIPEGVISIGNEAFVGCTTMETITIPSSVTELGRVMFDKCEALTQIVVAENNPSYRSIDGNLYTKDGKTLVAYTIGKTETTFVLPNGVEVIGEYAIMNSYTLKYIILNEGLTTVKKGAMLSSPYIESVVLPNSLAYVEEGAFEACYALTNIYYVGTVEDWERIVIDFDEHSALFSATRYYYSEKQPTTEGNYWHYVDGVPTVWETYVKPDYSVGLEYTSNGDGTCYVSGIGTCTDTDVIIPEVSPDGWIVTGIGDNVFWNNQNITSIKIPNSIVEIGSNAFANCLSLGDVYISDLESWCNITFNSNPLGNVANLWLNNEMVTTLVIPASVTEIKQHSFEGCKSIQTVVFHNSVTKIGRNAFFLCLNIETLTIPDSVTDIDDWAFYWCSSLESVTIGEGLKNMGGQIFFECYSLKTLVFVDGATDIGNWMFGGCSSLTDVIIPKSMSKIARDAFDRCSSLQSIYYNGTMKEWNAIDKETGWNSGVPATEVICSDGVVSLIS